MAGQLTNAVAAVVGATAVARGAGTVIPSSQTLADTAAALAALLADLITAENIETC